MAGITLTQAQAQLDAYLAASLAVAKGQSYSIDGRAVTKADARVIRENITHWSGEVKRLTPGRKRVRYLVSEG